MPEYEQQNDEGKKIMQLGQLYSKLMLKNVFPNPGLLATSQDDFFYTLFLTFLYLQMFRCFLSPIPFMKGNNLLECPILITVNL